MDISSKQLEKFKTGVNKEYKVQEGDRVYISDYTSLKKRQVDLYFKNNFKDVKRVSKLEEANVVFDSKEYNGSSILGSGDYWVININGISKTVDNMYANSIPFFMYCKGVLSDQEMDKAFTMRYNYKMKDITHTHPSYSFDINEKFFNKNYPELYQKKNGLILRDDLDYSTILKDLDNIPIYTYTFLEKDVVNYLDENVRSSFEEIDFNSIEMLLTSKEENDRKLGITLMTNYDMREYFSELLCVLFKTACDTKLRKFLYRYPIFKELDLPNQGNRDSYLGNQGYSKFIECQIALRNKGYNINKDYVAKFLLNGL